MPHFYKKQALIGNGLHKKQKISIARSCTKAKSSYLCNPEGKSGRSNGGVEKRGWVTGEERIK